MWVGCHPWIDDGVTDLMFGIQVQMLTHILMTSGMIMETS